jgi:hypothetical protein
MENKQLKKLFDAFISNYPEEGMNAIWTNHSLKFKEFWYEKIMTSDKQELNDSEVDEIIRILDRYGKGNTAQSEAVARAMIAQGAWRRLFNQLKEEKQLSKTIDIILTSKDPEQRSKHIDKLYTLNEGNKNNLSGKSGNAINCFLAAFDPFENLSMVSLNDRHKLINVLGINYSIDNKSVGKQIVETSDRIKEKLKEAGIFHNARTITRFLYSKPFVEYWKIGVQEESATKIEEGYTIFPEEQTVQDDFIFYMEKQLEDFLIENWDKTELGKKYELIENEEGLVSQQYRTEIGIIDILVKDKKDGKYVIIELKKNRSSDDTVGQIARYMGWIEEHLSNGEESKGIIIAGSFDKKLKYAMRKIKGIEVYLYKVDFHLKEYKE